MTFPHWQFFESLDDELDSLSRVIEFAPENFTVFSVQLARLYLSICSEIDVVAKLLCARTAPSESADNINKYRVLVTTHFPNFAQLHIELPTYALDFQPWVSWASGSNPKWWKSYNDVKHQRNKYYRDANLGNVLESAAGLLVVLVYYHQPELYTSSPPLRPEFKTMRIERQYVRIPHLSVHWSLPDFGKSATG